MSRRDLIVVGSTLLALQGIKWIQQKYKKLLIKPKEIKPEDLEADHW